jgi:hypothetical protein
MQQSVHASLHLPRSSLMRLVPNLCARVCARCVMLNCRLSLSRHCLSAFTYVPHCYLSPNTCACTSHFLPLPSRQCMMLLTRMTPAVHDSPVACSLMHSLQACLMSRYSLCGWCLHALTHRISCCIHVLYTLLLLLQAWQQPSVQCSPLFQQKCLLPHTRVSHCHLFVSCCMPPALLSSCGSSPQLMLLAASVVLLATSIACCSLPPN